MSKRLCLMQLINNVTCSVLLLNLLSCLTPPHPFTSIHCHIQEQLSNVEEPKVDLHVLNAPVSSLYLNICSSMQFFWLSSARKKCISTWRLLEERLVFGRNCSLAQPTSEHMETCQCEAMFIVYVWEMSPSLKLSNLLRNFKETVQHFLGEMLDNLFVKSQMSRSVREIWSESQQEVSVA